LTWSRQEGKLLFDNYQLTNTLEKSWGITNYARYSQILEHKISVSGGATNEKTVELVKTMGFGLVKNGDNYELQSVTPIAIRKTKRDSMAYHITNVVFTSAKNQLILFGYRKLIPLPGISISRHLGSHKVKVQLNIRLIKPDTEFAAILSIKDKQFQLYKIAGNIYGGEVELPVLTKPDTMTIELIDKDSLTKNDDYNGYTFMFPVVD
jgi:hypothetical protein